MKKWLIVGGLFLASVIASAMIFAGVDNKKISQTTSDATSSAQIATPTPAPDPLAPVNFLLLGYGGAGHDGGYLSDTMILVKVIPKEERVLMFSIPRDLWVKLPFTKANGEDYYTKINGAYAIGHDDKNYGFKPDKYIGKNGGGELAKEVVAEIIGEPINYYVGVDFAGFKKTFNTLAGSNGLVVDVPYSFTDSFYPIEGKEDDDCGFSEEEIGALMEEFSDYKLETQFACRYEEISYTQGKQKLTADQALKFVRSRHSAVGGSDFGRSQRQQALITSLRNEVITPAFLLKIPSLFMDLTKTITTDVDIKYVTKALTNYGDIISYDIESYVMDTNNLLNDARSFDGQYILQPKAGAGDFSEIQAFINEKTESSQSAELNF